MTTAELSTALPEIVTAQVPGPKSKELLDRRDAAIPKALCGKTYPICIKQGAGAMIGLELVKDKETKEPAAEIAGKLIRNALQKGLLLEGCGTAGNVIRFLAPLTMTDEQMEKGLEIFEEALREAIEA